MKKEAYLIIRICLISGLAIIISVYLLKMPALIREFDLSDSDKIATAISGLSGPVIGLISTILLYLALTKQTEANIEQRLKNESDIVIVLFNQLDQEINSFSTTESTGFKPNQIHDTNVGLVGLRIFCHRCTEPGYRDIIINESFGFHAFQEAPQIMIILESFWLLHQRILSIDEKSELKSVFVQKLNTFYSIKLKEHLERLSKTLVECGVEDQPFPKRIIQFVKDNED
ncbi:hypothetical protein [Chitinophaga defluvii]|uniref:Phage abortive infection protein n=1 Tax=Chitinophaga defluvii TaxID=3163343 RepID=A0ABV2TCI6_9BACT